MADKKEVRLTIEAKTAGIIAKYADKNDISVSEAVDRLVGTADSRLASLARYAKNKEPQAPGKPKAAKKAAKPKPAAKPRKAAAKKAAATNGAAAHA